ncbi:periplasmic protein [Paenibacillus wynnii]|uniref:Periplasmic protein n=2 Tax=Paenibacillus wynnii TaxID=268407 RepID=A0A098M2R9_9BACL|nr:periplasmic protein [Paenibacillus wynnii]KGE16700.1 periplasmic protein [Paenibacillus wynnii]
MRDKGTELWGKYEPFHIPLNDYRVANIVITNHAKSRYLDRISDEGSNEGDIAPWIWQSLRQKRIQPYSQHDQNAYLIDDDTVVIAEFTELAGERNHFGYQLYCMTIVSFLGKISRTPQLRDLRAYYSLLRQTRRVKMIKKRRKRK